MTESFGIDAWPSDDRRSRFVFHSGLSPLLNVGLLTPQQVLDRALRFGASHNVPLNSLEGLVRQILGRSVPRNQPLERWEALAKECLISIKRDGVPQE